MSSPISERTPAQRAAMEKARLEHLRQATIRAVDDPAQLARAARIVRAALERQRLTLEDIRPTDADQQAEPPEPAEPGHVLPPNQLDRADLLTALQAASDAAVSENQTVVLAGARNGRAVVVDDSPRNRRLPAALVVMPDVDVLKGQLDGGQLPSGAVHLTASDGRSVVVCGYDPAAVVVEGGADDATP